MCKQAVLLVLATFVAGSPAWSAVTRYYARETLRGEMELVGVTVMRGGGPVTIDATKLISVRIVHFRSNDPTCLVVPAGAAPPNAGQRDRLLRDRLLNSGLINPGGAESALATDPQRSGPGAAPGLAVEFETPVVNLPGDDVVFFEFHRELNSPPGGDAFHVAPLRFEPGLRAITIRSLDIHCGDAEALPMSGFDLYRLNAPPASLEQLESGAIVKSNGAPLVDFQILAVGIDLSDLGYAAGAEVSGLFFQDHNGSGLQVDPVLIAGLPAPIEANLLKDVPRESITGPQPGELLDQMLAGPLASVGEIVYAERVCGFDHWYANFGFYAATEPEYPPQEGLPDEQIPRCFGDGGRLCRLNLRTGQRTVLLDDAAGGVRDPQVHYEAQKILFSYRRGGEPCYHLYEIGIDGNDLVQLTGGPYDDIEPTYLPDGGILFVSSRCNRYVNCYRTPVATLYRCDADGANVRMISTNIEHDNTPWVLPDGRVIYMRWEYVDRSQFCFHHLWTANPDGTGQMVYFGNQFPDTAMLDAKPIPGTNQVVASFSPGHGRPGHMGAVTVIDPRAGPDQRAAARRVSRPGQYYRDPYALSDDCFLVADDRGLHVMDGQGNTEPIYRLSAGSGGLTCHEPRPLVPRPREPVIPPRVDPGNGTGRLLLGDLYEGRSMSGVRRGEIKRLLVLEQLPKPISFSGGMWPISVGGTFTLARILGTVPVQPDGSAYFEVPALRPLFFVALDENDLAVKRMQSFVSVQPGETLGCVGCHEQRLRPPLLQPAGAALLARSPSRIQSEGDVPEVLDYPRDIQPILDRHCVRCHHPERPDGKIDLCGDHTPLVSVSYWTLLQHGLISDGRNEQYGNRPPRTIGSSASRLLEYLDGGHYEARLSDVERKTVRLWIDSSAVYAGTYAALGSGMHPVEFPIRVMETRCGGCHGSQPAGARIGTGMYFRFGGPGPALPLVHEFRELQQIRGSIGYYKFGNSRPPQSLCNLSRPELSLLVRAPLPIRAGGLGRCGSDVFASTDDPGYREILGKIVAASQRHHQEKRFDMPGFRPNVYYVRKMQSYGILPPGAGRDDPLDVYDIDQAYWRSFWYDDTASSGGKSL